MKRNQGMFLVKKLTKTVMIYESVKNFHTAKKLNTKLKTLKAQQ